MDKKAFLALAACALSPAFAHAGPGGGLLTDLRKCAVITTASDRLACYDRLAHEFQSPTKTAAAPPSTKEEKESWFGLDNLFGGGEEKPQTTPQQFGQERVEKTPEQIEQAKKEEIDSITAKLSDYATNAYGKFIVFLDNGQVWAQLQADSGKAHFAKNPKDVTVTIERAFLGSYSMTISDNVRLFKVRRVK